MRSISCIIAMLGILCAYSSTAQLTSATNGLSSASGVVSLGGTLNNAQTLIDFGSSNASSTFTIKKGTATYLSILNNGNTGFGVLNPTAPLDVNGIINATQMNLTSSDNIFRLGGSTQFKIDLSSGGNGDAQFRYGSGGGWSLNFNIGGNHISRIWDGGIQVGLGNANGTSALHIRRIASATNIAQFENNAGTVQFIMLDDGKTGLGNSTPVERLDVSGNIKSNGRLIANKPIVNDVVAILGLFGYSNTADNRSVSIQQIGNASTANQYLFLNGGLGSSSVTGTQTLTSVFTPSFGLESNDNNLNIITAAAGTNIAAKRAMSFVSNGNVGIGTTNPQTKLDLGEIRFGDIASFPAEGSIGEGVWGNYIVGDVNSLQRLRIGVANDGATRAEIFIDNSNRPDGTISLKTASDNNGAVTRLFINGNGNVGIGTSNPQALLAVNGDIFSKKVKVTLTGWSDYVFDNDYKLLPLSEVEKFINENKHLPDVPSTAEVEKDGIDLGSNQTILLKKIEELTLYVIDQNKKMEEQQKKIQMLEKALNRIDAKAK